jgi:hypothetical protein
MSNPSTNWSYTSAPVPVNSGRAVRQLTIVNAKVGTLAQVSAPMISVPSNLHYFKAYGGDSTDGGEGGVVINFTDVDPVSSSAFSLTTKKYTAPVNGFYRFAALCYSAGDSETHVSLRRIRGSETITLQYVALKNVWESSGFSTEVFLEAGDEVGLYVNDGRVRLADYNNNFTLSSLTYEPRTTFEGRLVYQTA